MKYQVKPIHSDFHPYLRKWITTAVYLNMNDFFKYEGEYMIYYTST